ncbi:MAG: CDC27 family protein [Campylobacterota bacterium]|nr:CDC27 family protein [Campylobacterota bacterium]
MLNVIELERRWLRYKVKSYIPHLSIVISLLIISLLIFTFSSNQKDNVKTKKAKPADIIQKPKEMPKPTVVHKPIEVIQTITEVVPDKSHKIKLEPSLDFMKKMNNSANPNYRNESSINNHASPYKKPTQMQEQTIIQKKEVVYEEVKKEPTQQKVNIKRQNTQNDIYDIIKRFKKNNNPALSLFVAKKYYELGNYRQAYNYALMTNKINKEIETSWIIFAKSLVKLGKKDKAITTLKEYMKHSNSNRASILLDEIQSGKFK